MVGGKIQGFQPELAGHPLSLNVNMLWLVAIEAIEEEAIRSWYTSDPGHCL
jgi:hypothetical protein